MEGAGSTGQPRLDMPFSVLLAPEVEGEAHELDDSITEFTRSSVWYGRNAEYLVHRSYLAHFERGKFSVTDATTKVGSEFRTPFLPKKVRHFLENQRVFSVPHGETGLRLLHFPITYDEFRLIVSFLVNSGATGADRHERLVFALRNAAKVMTGRVGFDVARMAKELVEMDFAFEEQKACLVAMPRNSRVEREMSKSTVVIRECRAVAVAGKAVAIATDKAITVILTDERQGKRYNVNDVVDIAARESGSFLAITRAGRLVSISDMKAKNLMTIDAEVKYLKVSHGGDETFAVSTVDRKRIFYGCAGSKAVSFRSPVVDFAINNEDLYVCTNKKLFYYMDGEEVLEWNVDTSVANDTKITKEPHIRHVSVDPSTMTVACCSDRACFVVDSRMPTLVGITVTDTDEILSFHPSPLLDIAVITHNRGFATVDMRQPGTIFSNFRFSRSPIDVKGSWMPGTRLFGMTLGGNFAVACPYLSTPVFEAYRLPVDRAISVFASAELSVLHQPEYVTFFGGSGTRLFVPSTL